MLNEVAVQRRSLKMHHGLLWSVIHKQAGTIGKALLEGVMNSVDAGATECRIEVSRTFFEIYDNGRGFSSDDEIENFFETFGTPHEDGDAAYGRFRMGRGQMMAFGVNVWRSNNYQMVVDLKHQHQNNAKNSALGYDFYKVSESYPGCHIQVELYDKLSPSELDAVIREVTESMRYVQIPVFLNGKEVSIDPATEQWDVITDDAYIRRRSGGSLDIYNLGVLVAKEPQYSTGTSGVVVSKKALDVNFARSAVQANCPTWKRIHRVLRDGNMRALKRKTPLNDAQRDFFARQLYSGELSVKDLGNNRIINDITNSNHPMSIFLRLAEYGNTVTVAAPGNRIAEIAHTRKLSFVVTDEMAARFNASTAVEFVDAVKKIYSENNLVVPAINSAEMSDFEGVISLTHEPLDDNELTKVERLSLKALRDANSVMYRVGRNYDSVTNTQTFSRGEYLTHEYRNYQPRKISVGSSDVALAWTDGTHNIWFERQQLKLIADGIPGMVRLANIMLHEYLHNEITTGTHDHGVEFYSRHHDLNICSDIIAKTANAMMNSILKSLRKEGKAIKRTYAHYEDNVAQAADLGVGEELGKENNSSSLVLGMQTLMSLGIH